MGPDLWGCSSSYTAHACGPSPTAENRVQNFGPLLPDNRTHSYRASEPTRVPMTLHCPSPPTLQTSRCREMSATSYVFCMLRCKAASDAWERGAQQIQMGRRTKQVLSVYGRREARVRARATQRHFRIFKGSRAVAV